jgi:hypothetical protein
MELCRRTAQVAMRPYGSFDTVPRKRGVFRSRDDRRLICCRGGSSRPEDHGRNGQVRTDCRDAMAVLTRELEATPGPAGNLQLRFGLHNGPVTAGVLRGEKSTLALWRYC